MPLKPGSFQMETDVSLSWHGLWWCGILSETQVGTTGHSMNSVSHVVLQIFVSSNTLKQQCNKMLPPQLNEENWPTNKGPSQRAQALPCAPKIQESLWERDGYFVQTFVDCLKPAEEYMSVLVSMHTRHFCFWVNRPLKQLKGWTS